MNEARKDINGKRPDHPDFDESTLYVPQVNSIRRKLKIKLEFANLILFRLSSISKPRLGVNGGPE